METIVNEICDNKKKSSFDINFTIYDDSDDEIKVGNLTVEKNIIYHDFNVNMRMYNKIKFSIRKDPYDVLLRQFPIEY